MDKCRQRVLHRIAQAVQNIQGKSNVDNSSGTLENLPDEGIQQMQQTRAT